MEEEYLSTSFSKRPGTIAKITRIKEETEINKFDSGFMVYEYNINGTLKQPYHVPKKRKDLLDERFYTEIFEQSKNDTPKIEELKKKRLKSNYNSKEILDKMITSGLISVGGVLLSVSSLLVTNQDLLLYLGIYISSASSLYFIDKTKEFIIAREDEKVGKVIRDYEENRHNYTKYLLNREKNKTKSSSKEKNTEFYSEKHEGSLRKKRILERNR